MNRYLITLNESTTLAAEKVVVTGSGHRIISEPFSGTIQRIQVIAYTIQVNPITLRNQRLVILPEKGKVYIEVA